MRDHEAARQLYEAKGFARRVGWGSRPAVLVIDLTSGFTDPASPLGSDLSEVIGETSRLLAAARGYEVPVVFTSIAYDDPDLEGGYWVSKIPALRVLRHGTPAVEVDARLLRRLRVDTLLLCGTSTSGCVRAAAADAVQLGFRCIVPESAVGDRAEAPHRANLFDIDAKYGDVMPLDEVLAELDRWARRNERADTT